VPPLLANVVLVRVSQNLAFMALGNTWCDYIIAMQLEREKPWVPVLSGWTVRTVNDNE
jgi:hypothetical protein